MIAVTAIVLHSWRVRDVYHKVHLPVKCLFNRNHDVLTDRNPCFAKSSKYQYKNERTRNTMMNVLCVFVQVPLYKIRNIILDSPEGI